MLIAQRVMSREKEAGAGSSKKPFLKDSVRRLGFLICEMGRHSRDVIKNMTETDNIF